MLKLITYLPAAWSQEGLFTAQNLRTCLNLTEARYGASCGNPSGKYSANMSSVTRQLEQALKVFLQVVQTTNMITQPLRQRSTLDTPMMTGRQVLLTGDNLESLRLWSCLDGTETMERSGD